MDEQSTLHQLPESGTIPVVQEFLQLSKQLQETGKVRIAKTVVQETVNYQMPLLQEELITERKEINQIVDVAPPPIRQEGDTTIITVLKEVVVTEKKLLLVEEVHITRRKTEQIMSGTEVVRKEQITVQRTDCSV